jgi:hypothetical protein
LKRKYKYILVIIVILFLPLLAFGPGIMFIKKNFLTPSLLSISTITTDMSPMDNSVEIKTMESSVSRSTNPKVPAFPKGSSSYEIGKAHLLSHGIKKVETSIDVADQFAWENSPGVDPDPINDRNSHPAGFHDGIIDIGLPDPYYNYPSIPGTKNPDWAGSETIIRGPSFAYLLPNPGGRLPAGGSSLPDSGSANDIPPGTGDKLPSGGSPPPHSGLADGITPGLEETPPGAGVFLPDSGSANTSVPVPEPGTLILFGSGLLGVAVFRRKTLRK